MAGNDQEFLESVADQDQRFLASPTSGRSSDQQVVPFPCVTMEDGEGGTMFLPDWAHAFRQALMSEFDSEILRYDKLIMN